MTPFAVVAISRVSEQPNEDGGSSVSETSLPGCQITRCHSTEGSDVLYAVSATKSYFKFGSYCYLKI